MTATLGIEALRASLGLGAAEEALVRSSAGKLAPEVERWVEQFYARLVVDPIAMTLLADESRVLRLKRSLVAWFLEMFSLPFDEDYERARRDIGIVHVRIGMPLYLMVTAMNGIRRDVGRSAAQIWPHDPTHAHRVSEALSKVLDLELALMLEAYRRRQRELERQGYAALQAEAFASQVLDRLAERVDAALCYAEVLRASPAASREAVVSRLTHVLRGCIQEELQRASFRPSVTCRPVHARDLCHHASANVSLGAHGLLEVDVHPPTLVLWADAERLQRSLEGLLQGLANLQRGGVRLLVRSEADGAAFTAVLNDRSEKGLGGWEALEAGGIDVGTCTYVARLHGGSLDLARDGGGEIRGLRLWLPLRQPSGSEAHESPVVDPPRAAS